MKLRVALAIAVSVVLAGTIGFAQGKGRVVESTSDEVWEGVFVPGCDDGAFDVMNRYEATWKTMTRHDRDGQIVQEVRTVTFTSDVFWNSVTEKSLTGGPGERNEVRLTYEDGVLVNIFSSGPILRIRVPGYGPIFIETGHTIYDANHQPVFNAGHNEYLDWDPAAVAALCNALK